MYNFNEDDLLESINRKLVEDPMMCKIIVNDEAFIIDCEELQHLIKNETLDDSRYLK